jgi:hypothetical protein
MIAVDDTPIRVAKKHLSRLEKDFQDRDGNLAKSIDSAKSENQANEFRAQREKLKGTYDRAFASARDEIAKAQTIVDHRQLSANEESKLKIEAQKAKTKADLASTGVSDEDFERLWPSIRDRIIVEKAAGSVTKTETSQRVPVTL